MKACARTLSLSAALLLSSAASLAQEAPAAPATPAPTFATGAASISETHGDWTLICGVQEAQKACVITQTLGDAQSGQRVVSVELEAAGGGVEGSLMLPFGLRLAEGVRTLIDGVPVGETVPFATCYANGCLASFALDGEITQLLKRGKEFNLVTVADDSGENVQVKASLTGFSSALARSIELTS